MIVKIKKLRDNAVIPVKAHPSDAGFDLVAATDFELDEDGNAVYYTGLAFEIPEGYVGLIFPRSSITKKDQMIANGVGVVDSNYRGEVSVKCKMISPMAHEEYLVYRKGERVAQMIIVPYPEIEFQEADELSETDRGANGYGSTGK